MVPEPAAARATVHVTPAERRLIDALLAEHLPGIEVRAFGSRAHGCGLKRWSDLDLAVMDAKPIPAPATRERAGARSVRARPPPRAGGVNSGAARR